MYVNNIINYIYFIKYINKIFKNDWIKKALSVYYKAISRNIVVELAGSFYRPIFAVIAFCYIMYI